MRIKRMNKVRPKSCFPGKEYVNVENYIRRFVSLNRLKPSLFRIGGKVVEL